MRFYAVVNAGRPIPETVRTRRFEATQAAASIFGRSWAELLRIGFRTGRFELREVRRCERGGSSGNAASSSSIARAGG